MDGFSYLAQKAREKERKHFEAEGRPALKPHEVVTHGHQVALSTLNRQSTVGKIAHEANDYGWQVKVGHSQYRTAEQWRVGTVVPGRVEDYYWAEGVVLKDGKPHRFKVSKLIMVMDGQVFEDKKAMLVLIADYGDEIK